MKFKDFKANIKDSGSFNVPDNLNKIDYLAYIPERQYSKPFSFKRVGAILDTFAFKLIAIFSFLNYQPVTTLSLEFNPQVTMKLNRFNRIIEVEAENSDASLMLDEISLKNKTISKAVDLIYDYAGKNNLLINDNLYVLYGVIGDDDNQVEKIESLISTNQNQLIKPMLVHAISDVVTEIESSSGALTPNDSVNFDQENAYDYYEQKRDSLEISSAKMALIMLINQENPEYALETLANMELYELYDILN